MPSNPALVYHVTPQSNLASILKQGLQPTVGPRSQALGETVPAIYTFASRKHLSDALGNWMADAFDEENELAILTLRVPPQATRGQGAGFECVLLEPIAPENILCVQDEQNQSLSLPGSQPSWLGFRAGPMESTRGLFFADSFDAAWFYAQQNGADVYAYALRPQRVWTMENQYAWEANRLRVPTSEVIERQRKSRNPYGLRDLDKRILSAAREAGFDAIEYTRPTTPNAQSEMVLLDARNCERIGVCNDQGMVMSVTRSPEKNQAQDLPASDEKWADPAIWRQTDAGAPSW